MRTGLPFDDVLAAAQAGAAWAFEVLYRDLVAVGHRLPAAARRRRARRPGQRDLHRRLHRAGRVQRRRGRAARLGLHHRPPPAGRRLAAPQPPSPGGRRPGRPHRAARRRRRGRRPGRRRHRHRAPAVRRAARRPARRCSCCASWPTSRSSRSPQAMGRSVGVGEGAPAPRSPGAARPELENASGKSWCRRVPLRSPPAMTGVR